MGVTKQTRDKIKAMSKNGYTAVDISKAMNIPESIIRHIIHND